MREFQFLRHLTAHVGEVALRDTLLNTLWGFNFGGNTRVLDQMVFHLRQKLGRDAACIETVHGAGFRYVP